MRKSNETAMCNQSSAVKSTTRRFCLHKSQTCRAPLVLIYCLFPSLYSPQSSQWYGARAHVDSITWRSILWWVCWHFYESFRRHELWKINFWRDREKCLESVWHEFACLFRWIEWCSCSCVRQLKCLVMFYQVQVTFLLVLSADPSPLCTILCIAFDSVQCQCNLQGSAYSAEQCMQCM